MLIEIAGQPERNPGAAPEAVQFLGEFGPTAKRALPVLTRCCTYKAEEELGFGAMLRSEALLAVAAVGGVVSLPTLKEVLGSADAFDREAAANALSLVGPGARDAVPDLIQALQDDRGVLASHARGAAARALGSIGPNAEAAISTLKTMATANYERWDAWLADAAVEALTRIGEPERKTSTNRSGRD